MVLTESKRLELGMIAPDFTLVDTVSGKNVALGNIKWEQGTVIMFICNHCPFVVHVNSLIVELAQEYQQKWITFIAISSNDVETHPQDGPEMMKSHAQTESYCFPYLYDESQEVAKSYNAACTPDIFFFGKDLELVYHGQFDDSRPGNNIPVSGADFRNALDTYLESWEIISNQKPLVGCNIKWKAS